MKWGALDRLMLLWLLVPAALLLYYLLRRRLRLLAQLADLRVFETLAPDWHRKRARTRAILWLAAVGFMLVGLARPQWGFRWEEVRRRGLDLMVVLDTSRSMLAEDIKPNRLQQAKWGISDLVKKLRGDRVGIVSFAGSSFLQCPLTSDYAAFLMTLDDVYVGMIPRGGTAIAQAVRTAAESFEASTEADRVILLITDGEDHEGDIDKTIEMLKEKGIRLFAVGLGSTEGELIPVPGEDGRTGFLKDGAGNVVKSSLHEDTLERLVLATGGMYIRAAPGDIGVERLIGQGLSKLTRQDSESKMIKAYEERFYWPLGVALALLALEAAVPERRKRRREAVS